MALSKTPELTASKRSDSIFLTGVVRVSRAPHSGFNPQEPSEVSLLKQCLFPKYALILRCRVFELTVEASDLTGALIHGYMCITRDLRPLNIR